MSSKADFSPSMADAARRQLSICFVVTSLAPGGAETQAVMLAEVLASRGHRISLVPLIDGGTLAERAAAAGIPLYPLRMTRGRPSPRSIFDLANIVRRTRPGVVHSHMVHANLLARVAHVFAPGPVYISTAHNLDEGGRWRDLAYRLTDPLAHTTTNVSRRALSRYINVRAIKPRRAMYVPNGVDVSVFHRDKASRRRIRSRLGISDDTFVWLYVGRLEYPKDPETLLRAIAKMSRPDLLVLIAGRGTELERLRALQRELRLDDSARFLGFVRSELPAVYSAADAFVLATRLEGLPMVLLEAAASGLPLVATDVGGAAEVVGSGAGAAGVLVPESDVDALAKAMSYIMHSDRQLLSARARARVLDEYDIQVIASLWEEIYGRLMRGVLA